jgi:hypothetical protein
MGGRANTKSKLSSFHFGNIVAREILIYFKIKAKERYVIHMFLCSRQRRCISQIWRLVEGN